MFKRKRARIIIPFLLVALVLLVLSCSKTETGSKSDIAVGIEPGANTIVDMAGRTVNLPSKIESVYATHSIGTLFVYTLAPDLVAGWNFALMNSEKQFIKKDYYNLPVLGRWKGTGSANTEELLLAAPDIIINMGDLTPTYISESNEAQEILNIPVVMVDGSITHQADSYEFLGKLLGREKRATLLSEYSRGIVSSVKEHTQTIDDTERIRVYYGAGMNGLETVPKGSINTEVLDLVGGTNVADPGVNENLRRLEISIEQLLQWNPSVIILSANSSHNEELYELIVANESWQNIDAVKHNQVYVIPYGPYDWFSQPPTLLRLMGLQWLGNRLYPNLYNLDITIQTKSFFELFFDLQLNDQQLNEMFEHS
jgi:iron complex transport system substrate-binding protein